MTAAGPSQHPTARALRPARMGARERRGRNPRAQIGGAAPDEIAGSLGMPRTPIGQAAVAWSVFGKAMGGPTGGRQTPIPSFHLTIVSSPGSPSPTLPLTLPHGAPSSRRAVRPVHDDMMPTGARQALALMQSATHSANRSDRPDLEPKDRTCGGLSRGRRSRAGWRIPQPIAPV